MLKLRNFTKPSRLKIFIKHEIILKYENYIVFEIAGVYAV